MRHMIMGAIALALISGTASAADLSSSASYQDRGVYTASVSLADKIGPVKADLTGVAEINEDWYQTHKLEVGITPQFNRVAVRVAVGEYFGRDNFSYYSVTPSVTLDVPYTDAFTVSARYRNSFGNVGYETYGFGAKAGWDVGSVRVSVGAAKYYGDSEYAEYSMGVSRSF